MAVDEVFHDDLLLVGVSENSGTPKSSVLIGFSIVNHPFWGTTIFGNTLVESTKKKEIQGKSEIAPNGIDLHLVVGWPNPSQKYARHLQQTQGS